MQPRDQRPMIVGDGTSRHLENANGVDVRRMIDGLSVDLFFSSYLQEKFKNTIVHHWPNRPSVE